MPQVNPAPSLDQAQPQLPQDVLQEAAAIPMDASPPPAPAPTPTAPSSQPPPASAAAGSDPAVTPTSPASPGGGAAADGGASQSHGVSVCQVDDCGADLARSKPYHRRHRVCETHAKSSETLVAGHTQRFCQMCSRLILYEVPPAPSPGV